MPPAPVKEVKGDLPHVFISSACLELRLSKTLDSTGIHVVVCDEVPSLDFWIEVSIMIFSVIVPVALKVTIAKFIASNSVKSVPILVEVLEFKVIIAIVSSKLGISANTRLVFSRALNSFRTFLNGSGLL